MSTRKFVSLNNVIHERSLTLFEKQLADLIQTDRGDMNTIIKKLKDISQNRHFLISKVESEDIFSALKRVKTYLRLTTARTNIRSLSCHEQVFLS